MATAFTTIKDFIEQKLNTITKIQEVYDEPRLDFNGYPAAVIIPSDLASDYETTTENVRTYGFICAIFHETQKTSISDALDTLYDLADDILDDFDTDQQLSGISLPSGYTIIAVNPVIAGWGQVIDKKLIELDLTIKVRISVDIS